MLLYKNRYMIGMIKTTLKHDEQPC